MSVGSEWDPIPSQPSSDVVVRSNDDVVFAVDANNDEYGVFVVRDYDGTNAFRVYEDGRVFVGSTLAHGSDRNRKHDIIPVDPADILKEVNALPVSRRTFNGQEAPHVGPMAQDFHEVFGLGEDDTSIATVDADGVALAAIQGLYKRLVEAER